MSGSGGGENVGGTFPWPSVSGGSGTSESDGNHPSEEKRRRTRNDPVSELVKRESLVTRIKGHLVSSMPELIELVRWNASLMARLHACGIISPADIAELEAQNNSHEKTSTFFMLIHQRLTPENLDMYNQVINSFKEVKQTGVEYALKKVYYG